MDSEKMCQYYKKKIVLMIRPWIKRSFTMDKKLF